ncbi:MAG TPA: SAM hydroxide adenosyltransferase, partial [Verrucomicrobiae bacterium]|nr:SAM hydroxide adenosyltransferase [Verrucomicrobiae bacterium]
DAELAGQGRACEAHGKCKVRCRVAEFYGAAAANRPVAVIGSSGFLEIAVNVGSAAKQYGLKVGDTVVARVKYPSR